MRNFARIFAAIVMLGAITALAVPLGQARSTAPMPPTPGSGTLSQANPTVSYTSGPFFVSNPTGQVELMCDEIFPCDDFALTVVAPAIYSGTQNIRIQVGWPTTANDFDLYILDSMGNEITASASSSDPEVAIIPAVEGTNTYTVRVVPFAVTGDSITGNITFEAIPPPPPPGAGAPPRYQNYVSPPDLGNDAGEPSIGVNWNTDAVMYIAGLQTLRVTFTDTCTSPAPALWEDKSYVASVVTLDPILFTDRVTGRTFSSQLSARTSIMGLTDDDGETYTPSEGGSALLSAVDHQTVGGGPYAPPLPLPAQPYTHAVYYCSQDIADATCARSDTGGLTFNPPVPIYTIAQCGGLHGHVKVAPDGTVYVPNKGCGGQQAVVRSTDNGTTWTVLPVTGSTPGDTDPSLGIGADGTLYFGFQDAVNHPKVSVSHDRGATWSAPVDVGVPFGIQNAVFPSVVAGDADRAAFTFIGTPTGGNYQDLGFTGVWHVYVAQTFDGGLTWLTVDVTPTDPVQRGSICTGGTTCGTDRNLLDFYDITVDREGRVLIGYADGCIGGCVQGPPNSFSAKATIARQSGGRRLFAAYDPAEPGVPGAPNVTATRDSLGDVHLDWTAPDDGGSPITEYRVFRSPDGTNYTQIGTTNRTNYDDLTADPSTPYFYRVIAVNAVGQSAPCNAVQVSAAVTPESPCGVPGVTALTDPNNDALDTNVTKSHEIERISMAEPFFPGGESKVVFTLKMASLDPNNVPPSPLTPSTSWRIFFTPPMTTTVYFADMRTDAANAVTFKYGTGTAGTPLGDADEGSGYSPDGTITIVLSTNKINNPAPGQRISSVYSRIIVGAIVPDNANFPNPNSGIGYTLVGNAFCGPNGAPVAVLNAAPTTGTAPLVVKFDGSNSSDPDGDDIVSYRYIFGDGQVISTTQTMVSHTYTQTGTFRAQLNVMDERGRVNENIAQVVIVVAENCTVSPDYVVTPASGAAIVPGTSYVPGSTCNSCTVQVTLPFSYSFYGTPYTQVNVSNGGTVQFVSNNPDGGNTCLPNAAFNDTIFAYWDNANSNINDTLGIYTSTTGVAPNRVFNIEWRSGYVANDVRSGYELRLYEGQPKFETIYGNTRGGFSATIGVQKGTGERSTQYACNVNGIVPAGTKLTFDQRVCSTAPTKPKKR